MTRLFTVLICARNEYPDTQDPTALRKEDLNRIWLFKRWVSQTRKFEKDRELQPDKKQMFARSLWQDFFSWCEYLFDE